MTPIMRERGQHRLAVVVLPVRVGHERRRRLERQVPGTRSARQPPGERPGRACTRRCRRSRCARRPCRPAERAIGRLPPPPPPPPPPQKKKKKKKKKKILSSGRRPKSRIWAQPVTVMARDRRPAGYQGGAKERRAGDTDTRKRCGASMEIGIYTFGELTSGSAGQRMRDLLEEIELADQVGLDVFGVGEHHRPDFVFSSPAVVLAAAARTTKRIRLTSAVSVISSDDPIRVFQDFATVDLISAGRAEIMAGRGSFIESFGLFGFDLETTTSCSRPSSLRLLDGPLARSTWASSRGPSRTRCRSGSRSAGTRVGRRAGLLGLPMALAIIGGYPERFAPFAELHRRATTEGGHATGRCRSTRTASSPRRSQEAVKTSASRRSRR